MGRHSAPVPADAEPPRLPLPPQHGIATPRRVERATVAAPVQASSTRSPDAAQTPAPVQAPVRTLGTPAAEALPLGMPTVAATSLTTGPILLQPAQRVRAGSRWTRSALGLVALAITGIVAVQITAQRSDAADLLLPAGPPPAGSSLATTATPGTTSTTPRAAPTTVGASPSASGPSPTANRPSVSAAPSTASAGTPASTAIPSFASSSAAPASTSAAPTRPSASASASSSAPVRPSSSAPTSTPRETPTPAPSSSRSDSAPPSVTRSLRGALSGGTLPAGRFRFDDFGSDLVGVDLDGRLTGAGSGDTVIEMTPNSSSKRSRVPTKAWTTNQLSLLRVSGASAIGGFTLRGTDQGHLYNGLRISRSSGARISDLRVLSIPGNDDIPPGETFGINDFRTSGSSYTGVEVDGSGISGAAFGTNSSSDVSIRSSNFHDAGHSNGATFWQTRNVTVRDTTSVRNKDAAFNFERVSGTVVLDHVTMRDNALSDLRINSDQDSAVYRIIDPVLDGKTLTIVMTPKYMGHPNVQKKSDVHVIIDGVDRTDDVVRWVDHF
jgi:hypothetical protein